MQYSLYLDGTTGISGDMIVAALLDLGADQAVLQRALDSIPEDGFQTRISRVIRSGIDACDFAVILDAEHENHDHDMEWLFGTGRKAAGQGHEGNGIDPQNKPQGVPHHEDESVHIHDAHYETHGHHHDDSPIHGHVHHHEAVSAHGHAHHHHAHRHLPEIEEMIERCDMTETAKATARKTFRILAEAEAEAHHSTPETVGFHEAGAIDSIVDIIAASVCIDNLKPAKVLIPVLYEGRGTVRCQHGILPVPVPAVVNIVRKYGIPLHIADYRGEYVTPTGAAFAAAIATDYTLPETFRILKTGTGAGKRDYAVPGLLRALMIEETAAADPEEETVVRLESNIDDSTGEELGYVLEKLFEAGARDVHYFPVYMKKNRPAYQLNVICMPEDVSRLEQIIFRETSTIGIRRTTMDRTLLPRVIRLVETSLGKAEVKVVDLGEEKRYYPEYRSAVDIASRTGLPLRIVMRQIETEAAEIFLNRRVQEEGMTHS